ncbi:MAG: hypothetical protein WC264_00645 [Candidatus Paceibacterota bacterium]|jgi:hypothetical protein
MIKSIFMNVMKSMWKVITIERRLNLAEQHICCEYEELKNFINAKT